MTMTNREQIAASISIGLPFAWLFLLDTGLIHYGSYGAALFHVATALAFCAAIYAGLRYWSKTSDQTPRGTTGG